MDNSSYRTAPSASVCTKSKREDDADQAKFFHPTKLRNSIKRKLSQISPFSRRPNSCHFDFRFASAEGRSLCVSSHSLFFPMAVPDAVGYSSEYSNSGCLASGSLMDNQSPRAAYTALEAKDSKLSFGLRESLRSSAGKLLKRSSSSSSKSLQEDERKSAKNFFKKIANKRKEKISASVSSLSVKMRERRSSLLRRDTQQQLLSGQHGSTHDDFFHKRETRLNDAVCGNEGASPEAYFCRSRSNTVTGANESHPSPFKRNAILRKKKKRHSQDCSSIAPVLNFEIEELLPPCGNDTNLLEEEEWCSSVEDFQVTHFPTDEALDFNYGSIRYIDSSSDEDVNNANKLSVQSKEMHSDPDSSASNANFILNEEDTATNFLIASHADPESSDITLLESLQPCLSNETNSSLSKSNTKNVQSDKLDTFPSSVNITGISDSLPLNSAPSFEVGQLMLQSDNCEVRKVGNYANVNCSVGGNKRNLCFAKEEVIQFELASQFFDEDCVLNGVNGHIVDNEEDAFLPQLSSETTEFDHFNGSYNEDITEEGNVLAIRKDSRLPLSRITLTRTMSLPSVHPSFQLNTLLNPSQLPSLNKGTNVLSLKLCQSSDAVLQIAGGYTSGIFEGNGTTSEVPSVSPILSLKEKVEESKRNELVYNNNEVKWDKVELLIVEDLSSSSSYLGDNAMQDLFIEEDKQSLLHDEVEQLSDNCPSFISNGLENVSSLQENPLNQEVICSASSSQMVPASIDSSVIQAEALSLSHINVPEVLDNPCASVPLMEDLSVEEDCLSRNEKNLSSDRIGISKIPEDLSVNGKDCPEYNGNGSCEQKNPLTNNEPKNPKNRRKQNRKKRKKKINSVKIENKTENARLPPETNKRKRRKRKRTKKKIDSENHKINIDRLLSVPSVNTPTKKPLARSASAACSLRILSNSIQHSENTQDEVQCRTKDRYCPQDFPTKNDSGGPSAQCNTEEIESDVHLLECQHRNSGNLTPSKRFSDSGDICFNSVCEVPNAFCAMVTNTNDGFSDTVVKMTEEFCDSRNEKCSADNDSDILTAVRYLYEQNNGNVQSSSKAVRWALTEGERALSAHELTANTLTGINKQIVEFEAFLSTAKEKLEKGSSLLQKDSNCSIIGEDVWRTNPNPEDCLPDDTSDLTKALSRHLSSFTDRLHLTRDRLEDTAKCYLILDKAYEWALEAMKVVDGVKSFGVASPEQVGCAARAIGNYLQENPPVTDDAFGAMLALATRLNNQTLLHQCKMAQARCQETTSLLKNRHSALIKARRQMEFDCQSFVDLNEILSTPEEPSPLLWLSNSTLNCSGRRKSGSSLGSCRTRDPLSRCSSLETEDDYAFPDSPNSSSTPVKQALEARVSLGEIKELRESAEDLLQVPYIMTTSRNHIVTSPPPSSCAHLRGGGFSSASSSCSSSDSSTDHAARKQESNSCSSWRFSEISAQSVEDSQTILDDSSLLLSPLTNKTTPPSSANSHLLIRGSQINLSNSEDLTEEEVKRNKTLLLIMQELIQTERDYVNSLEYIIENYIPELLREDIPQALRGQRNVIFGNIEKIFEFHSGYFLLALEACQSRPFAVGSIFLKYESQFYLYALYNKNKPKSDALMSEYGSIFFKRKQIELKDRMDLSSYLLKPVQRMGKYALLLKQLLKDCARTEEGYDDLQAAQEMVQFQLRHGNDLLAMDSLRDCDVNLKEQGRLLRQGEFFVFEGTRKKSFRHVFLFEDLILFSKARKDPDKKTLDIFQYKHSIKMTDIGLTEQIFDGPNKFEIWFRKRKPSDTYILQASSTDMKEAWTEEISKLLWRQALKNRTLRLHEMSSMGIGNKPCLDIRPSEDQISDRSVCINQLGKAPRLRPSLSQLTDQMPNCHRPQSVISISSNSSSSTGSSSQASSIGPTFTGNLNLGFEPGDSPRPLTRSVTRTSQCSAESGILADIYPDKESEDSHYKVERSNSSVTTVSADSAISQSSHAPTLSPLSCNLSSLLSVNQSSTVPNFDPKDQVEIIEKKEPSRKPVLTTEV